MICNTQQKGLSTEIHCLQDLTALGFQCLLPFGDSCKYDIGVDINGKIYRIQCKTSRWCLDTSQTKVAFIFNAYSQTTNTQNTVRYKYTKKDVDFFYTYFEGQGYLIPVSDVEGYFFRCRFEYPKTGQKQGIKIAEKYKVENVLGSITESI